MDSKLTEKDDRENQKFWKYWQENQSILMFGKGQLDDLETKNTIAEKLGLHKRSVTPTTLEKVIFEKSDEDLYYKEYYEHKGNEVLRFAINDSKLNVEQLKEEGLSVFESSKENRVPSIKTSVYKAIDTQNILHAKVEKFLVQEAISYLLNNKDTKVVLIDILARSIDQVIFENGIPEIHTVLLYKNSATENKHEVVVIDPSNFFFSSHLSNDDMLSSLKHDAFKKITTRHDQIQIYSAPDKNNIGSSPEQWRDCIDIAVKLAFVLDKEACKKDKPLEFIDLNTITKEYDFIQIISNAPNIDKSIKFQDVSCRIKQASDVNKMKQFFNIEKVFDKNLQMLKEVSSKSNDQTLQKFKEPYTKLYSIYNLQYKDILTHSMMNYDKVIMQLLEINNDMMCELQKVLNHEQQLLGDCNYEI
jgi:hypothetical protein